MKYVAYYPRRQYAPLYGGAVWNLNPTGILGTTEVPDGLNVYQVASPMWLGDNCPVGKLEGYDTPEEALSAARTELNAYWAPMAKNGPRTGQAPGKE